LDRLRIREVSVPDVTALLEWTNTDPELPDGPRCKDFGPFKLVGEGPFPTELFDGFAEMGWFELPFPEAQGGGGGGASELTIIAEALGRASLDVAQCFILTLMGALVIQRWGTDDMRAKLLPAVMRAERQIVASSGCPSVWDQCDRRTPHSPSSEGYLYITTRYRGHFLRCIQA
jgi:hypothetical protein